MIDLSSTRSLNRRERPFFLPIFAIGILLTAIFVASCGDEGDTIEDTPGMTEVLQPTTTPSETPTPPPVGELPPPEPPEVVEEPKVSFTDDIQPILAERCTFAGCHAAPAAAGLDLTKYDTFKKGGNGGAAFAAGNGKGSLVVKRIDGTQPPQMPIGQPPLDADTVQLFIDWIDAGAENN